MSGSLPEKDWKYLRSIEPELLSELCRKINQRAGDILRSESGTEHEKYLALYKHIEASDKIVADCFNDWRRSNLWLKLPLLAGTRSLRMCTLPTCRIRLVSYSTGLKY